MTGALVTPMSWTARSTGCEQVREAGPVRRRGGRAGAPGRDPVPGGRAGRRADRAGRRDVRRPDARRRAAAAPGPARGRDAARRRWPTLYVAGWRSTGGRRSPAPARGRSTCPPTPSSASATGSTPAHRRRRRDRGRPGRPPSTRCSARRSRWPDGDGAVLTGRLSRSHPALAGRPRGPRHRARPGHRAARAGPGRRRGSAPRRRGTDPPGAAGAARRSGGVAVQVRVGAGRTTTDRRAGHRPLAQPERRHEPPGPRTPPASLAARPPSRPTEPGRLAPGAAPTGVDSTASTSALADAGLAYGPAFQGLRRVWRRGDDRVRRGGAARRGGRTGSACTRRCSTPPCTPSAPADLLPGGTVGCRSRSPACRSRGAAPARCGSGSPGATAPTRCACCSPTPAGLPVADGRALAAPRRSRAAAARRRGAADRSLFGVDWAPQEAMPRRRSHAGRDRARRSRCRAAPAPARAGRDATAPGRCPRPGTAALLALLQAWLADRPGPTPGWWCAPRRGRRRRSPTRTGPRCGAWSGPRSPSTRAGSTCWTVPRTCSTRCRRRWCATAWSLVPRLARRRAPGRAEFGDGHGGGHRRHRHARRPGRPAPGAGPWRPRLCCSRRLRRGAADLEGRLAPAEVRVGRLRRGRRGRGRRSPARTSR